MPKLSLLFAKRYLLSRKSLSVINIISGVSSFTVAIPVMAMVVLLSVFNGFDTLIKSMYKNFDADIKITVTNARFFDKTTIDRTKIKALEGVEELAFVIEENALLEYRGSQTIATMKGVDSLYSRIVPIEKMVVRGEYKPKFGDINQVLVGQGIANHLMISTSLIDPMEIYVPRRARQSSVLPMDIYKKKNIFPSGSFILDNETDSKYVIVPIDFAQSLLEFDSDKVSAGIIKLKDGVNSTKIRVEIAQLLGDEFKVQTRYQQKESFYRIMQYEKWGIYFIILMVLVIASFSTVGSLVMIIIDKKKDTETLVTLGASRKLIRSIFMNEGLLISGIGAVIGLVLGVIICVLQQEFGFVKMAGTSFLIEAYPIEMRITDIIGVVISVATVNFIISWLTVNRLINKQTYK